MSCYLQPNARLTHTVTLRKHKTTGLKQREKERETEGQSESETDEADS